jgi:methyltransferase (TIGR00027 family)
MQDAARAHPICGDDYAQVFMNGEGMRIFNALKNEKGPNASNVARHRIIDDLLRQALQKNRSLTIVILGAGFDSRAYRLPGGNWIEVDEAAIIAHKNERLPVTICKNSLQRIAIDFGKDALTQKLESIAFTGTETIIVLEGVLVYLDEDKILNLLRTLHTLFPTHTLICDLMTRRFFNKFGRRLSRKIKAMGAILQPMDDPESLLTNNGYSCASKQSIVDISMKLQGAGILRAMVKIFAPSLLTDFSVFLFRHFSSGEHVAE